ncbi:hypothetical protein GCM10007875_05400 [Limnobacter litoralis]|uniref:Uncharacterized protein n=1 Tax=Limnobacter litoralis TaxID=481366 RepID=A0ABQ5YMV3_9BURK|nr:hypothetical protein GCM10007875_05400 [Limnobacter litoralis]
MRQQSLNCARSATRALEKEIALATENRPALKGIGNRKITQYRVGQLGTDESGIVQMTPTVAD